MIDRLASLNARSVMECKEPACGARGEDDELVSCSSPNCGEKLMMEGWRRELLVMRDIKSLIEYLERKEIEDAADRRPGKRR